MATNIYTSPSEKVEDIPEHEASPALWNPNAAANWSLLFTPIFGAILHMKNWEALDNPVKAKAAKVWAVSSSAVIIGLMLALLLAPQVKALHGLLRIVSFTLLLTWYFASAREQANYVKERFGNTYPRKGWSEPFIMVFFTIVGIFFAVFILSITYTVVTKG